MIDATSAFADQLDLLSTHVSHDATPAGTRYAPPATILLTHAHTGHYVGLWQLDRSVMAAKGVQVIAPPRMASLLRSNEPWTTMIHEGFIRITDLALDEPLQVTPNVTVTPIEVPHRAEWGTETVAFRVDGPNRSILYLPDIDAWDDWELDVNAIAGSVSVAIVDGCFWEPFPIPGVPHPPVRQSLERLQPVADAGARIYFTHLNHSNPLADADSLEAHEVRERGFAIVADGDAFDF
jgi:pyrroloquinoline quinone biosynthesis protein B